MKRRNLSLKFRPYHTWYGYYAPAISVDPNSRNAYSEALEKSTLCKRFPDQWILKRSV